MRLSRRSCNSRPVRPYVDTCNQLAVVVVRLCKNRCHATTVDQVNPALVYVTDGGRSVMVAAAAPITVAQVQASLVRAT